MTLFSSHKTPALLNTLNPLYIPPASALEPVYRDECLVAVIKPAGLLAVPGRGADKQDSLASRVQAEFLDALVVHRLDMATSGLMLFARGAEMQRRLSRLFSERAIQKRYVAVVAGRVAPPEGEVDLPLASDWPNRPKQKIDHSTGKHSLTRYRLLEHDAETNTSRLELTPVTGRTHQLRVHMAAIGHPILGDMLYGKEVSRAGRLLLHASALNFPHPFSAEPLALVCEPPF